MHTATRTCTQFYSRCVNKQTNDMLMMDMCVQEKTTVQDESDFDTKLVSKGMFVVTSTITAQTVDYILLQV